MALDIPTDQIDLAAPATAHSVPRLRARISEFVEANGGCSRRAADIRLAVSEAVSNVVLHAYAGEPGPDGEPTVELSAEATGDAIAVTVADSGRGLAPRPDSPGLGLGLPVIARLSDELDIVRRPSGGTALRMRFAC